MLVLNRNFGLNFQAAFEQLFQLLILIERLGSKMVSFHYERVSFSSLSYVQNDLGHNRNGENYRQIIERMAEEGYTYRGFMPIKWENGKPTDIDLIFEF